MAKLNFKNKEVKETSGFNQMYIGYGINLLKINGFEVKDASTGKIQIKLLVEGPEIGGGFEGADLGDGVKAKGLIGRVNMGIYFDKEDSSKLDWLMKNLMYIAEKADVLDKLKELEVDSIEELLEKFVKIVRGKFMWFVIKGDQYEKDGKTGFALTFKEGMVGKDGDTRLYQIYCKHKDFMENTIKDGDRIIKITGKNVVGSSIGKADSLEFNPQYDLKLLGTPDKESSPKDEVQAAKEDTDAF